ncbi:MAG: hypothetical protein GY847_15180 [Proteobacteria bacterium]|nr:hypothetical protein [Pseudomonadota bacterium]
MASTIARVGIYSNHHLQKTSAFSNLGDFLGAQPGCWQNPDMYEKILLFILTLFALGAGPCDMLDADEADLDMEYDAGDLAECTEIGCYDSLVVEVLRADNAAFLSGSYQVEIVAAVDTEYSIECYLSFTEAGLECTIGDLDVLIAQLEEGGQTIWVTLLNTPETAIVTMKYNESKIGERTLTPIYDEFFPNGLECPPTCRQAKESMAVESW